MLVFVFAALFGAGIACRGANFTEIHGMAAAEAH
jgi:hypothetical protein